MSEMITQEQKITFSQTIKWLWKFWGDLRIAMYLLIIFTPVSVILKTYTPMFLYRIFNELSKTTIDFSVVRYQTQLFLLINIVSVILYIFIQSSRGVINYKLENSFRVNIFNYIIGLSQSFFQKFNSGDLITRLVDDISEKKLAWFACSGVFRFYEAILIILGCIYFMSQLNLFLTIMTFLPLATLVFFYINISNKITTYSNKTQQAISKLNTFLTNTIDGIKIIKSYNQEEKQNEYFSKVVENQFQKEVELVKVSSLLELSYSRLSEIAIIFIFLIGGWLVINDVITLGALVAFNTYIFMLVWPMVDIGQFIIKGRSAGVSVQRIMELEDHKPDIVNSESPKKIPDNDLDLFFDNVTYTFPNGNNILKNISFYVKQGECVAIAGVVGSGKSTFINFIPRIIDPDSGKVLLNGVHLKDYDINSLRKSIGFVPQNPSLFSDTIKNNIVFGRENISEEDINKAIKVAQFDKELENFPDKLDTLIGQRGVTLSGGQKQRVAIARAIVEKPRILILDDCTSALDAETEANLWNELYKYIPGITVFLITHRVSTLQKADNIILLENGSISNMGKHSELIDKSVYYKQIYFSELNS